MKSKKNTDWIGLWYEIHKELGANDLFTFGIVDTNTNNIVWHDFSHGKYDGIDAISQLMEERGVIICKIANHSADATCSRERIDRNDHPRQTQPPFAEISTDR